MFFTYLESAYFSVKNWLAPLIPASGAFCDALHILKGEASGRMWLAQLSLGITRFTLSCVHRWMQQWPLDVQKEGHKQVF